MLGRLESKKSRALHAAAVSRRVDGEPARDFGQRHKLLRHLTRQFKRNS
jgi:hypothetical protein